MKQIFSKVGVNYIKNSKLAIFYEKLLLKSILKLTKFYEYTSRSFVNFDPDVWLRTQIVEILFSTLIPPFQKKPNRLDRLFKENLGLLMQKIAPSGFMTCN